MSENRLSPEAAPFERALANFKMGLKKRDLEQFKKTTLPDLKRCIGEIQEKQHASRRLQRLNRIQPFLEAMEQFGKVVTIFANSNDIIAFVWGPVKLLLLISNIYLEAFKELLDIYERIGESLPLLMQYEDLFRSNPQMSRVLALMYEDILTFHHSAMGYFQKPAWRQIFSATWKTYKSQFSEMISNMARHRELVESHANLAQIEKFQESRRVENTRFQLEARNEDLRRLKVVFDWLRPASVESDQYEFVTIRADYPGIGRWILKHPVFEAWFDPLYPSIPALLWLNGIPGAGKTILASLIVEECQKLEPTPTVLYFYCKHKNPERDNFRAVARTILAQLLKQDKDLLAYFYEKCCKSGETVLQSRTTIEGLLKEGFDSCKSAYIIIDGLDECGRESRKEITQWFRRLVEDLSTTEPERLRCLFVSQDDGIARKDFAGLSSIKIISEDTKVDLESYCRTQGERLKLHPFFLAPERAMAIAAKVSNSAAGMFLLAKLIWLNIFGQTSIAGLEEELEPDVFPTGVNEAYRKILASIEAHVSPTRWEQVLMVLGWLVCAKRPMRWYEIQALKAMNLDKDSIEFDQERFLINPEELLNALVVQREDGAVQLVHLSAIYFLVDEMVIDLPAEELKMATMCIDYLNLPTLASPTETAAFKGDYGLLDYATLYWIRHFEAGIQQAGDNEYLMTTIAESLDIFIQKHWSAPTSLLTVSQRNKDKLQHFRDVSFYDELEQAFVSTRKQVTFFGHMKKDEVALDIEEMVISVRQALEMAMLSIKDENLEKEMVLKYGTSLFKCPRFSCQNFSTGFTNLDDREKHVNKHERPFRCTEQACTGFTFGFVSLQDKQKHMRETHLQVSIEEEEFPTEQDVQRSMQPEPEPPIQEPVPTPIVEAVQENQVALPILHPLPASERTRKRERQKEFKCNSCGRVYTKKYNWKSHLLTHAVDKPFKCASCDAGFVRPSDLKRHESTHEEKRFKCYGELRDGGVWGCGKSFSRADELSSHHKSKKGQLCIRLLVQEQEMLDAGVQ